MEIAEVALIYSTKVKGSDRPKVVTSREAYDIFLTYWNPHTIELVEEFKVLLLNRANRVLGLYPVSSGGLTTAVADPRLVFVAALKSAAAGIILCHNHPSRGLKPSTEDELLTARFREAGKFLTISVLDHLIISPDGYYSFADEGRL